MAVEEPAFKTVMSDGAFEVRDYPSLVVAEVTVTGEQKEAASKGFRLLAGYIFGGNRRRQSIAMTAPVAQERFQRKDRHDGPRQPDARRWKLDRPFHDAERLHDGVAARTERSPSAVATPTTKAPGGDCNVFVH